MVVPWEWRILESICIFVFQDNREYLDIKSCIVDCTDSWFYIFIGILQGHSFSALVHFGERDWIETKSRSKGAFDGLKGEVEKVGKKSMPGFELGKDWARHLSPGLLPPFGTFNHSRLGGLIDRGDSVNICKKTIFPFKITWIFQIGSWRTSNYPDFREIMAYDV